MKRFFLLLLLLPTLSVAQFTYQFDQSIPVTVNDNLLKMPWAGGINAAQYNTIDLDNDGTADLVIFDRASNKLSTYLAKNNTYIYSPNYEGLFPPDINNWLIIKDYNCDGKKDIFTSSPFGITTYLNVGETLPTWQIDANPVITEGTNGPINLKINGDDLPAIIDYDGDGDLDIITFGFTGSGQLQYHQNLSMENSGTCDVADYKRTSTRWGDFDECDCGSFVYGLESCPTGGKVEHAGGKSLLAYDADNDGDYDLVIGEENCNQLHLLTNEGNNSNPLMRNAAEFPSSSPVLLFHYPTAYLEDVTFDGVPDLLVSTNFPFNTANSINYKNSSWLYQNTGTTPEPTFQFIESNFLQNEMIELGENAVPSFIDYDGDGDQDLFVVHRGKSFALEGYVSSIYRFDNVGTSTAPAFELVEDDFSSLSNLGLNRAKLQFADLNGDGTQDLMYSGIPKDGFSQIVTYALNKSTTRLDFSGQYIEVLSLVLDRFAAPFFYDINNDGFADLLLGKTNGNIEYYLNNGNAADFQFGLIDDAFYGIATSFTNRSVVPTVGDLNGDYRPELITTDGTGQLIVYDNFLSQINTPQEGVIKNIYNTLLNETDTATLGSWNWPTIVDLYQSGTPLIVLGTAQGGLRILKNTNAANPGTFNPGDILTIYPNPGSPAINNGKVVIAASKSVTVKVISILGNEVIPLTAIDLEHTLTIPVNYVRAGMYIALAYEGGKVVEVKRFVVVK